MSPGKDDSVRRLRVLPGGIDSGAPPADPERPSGPSASTVSSRPPQEPLSLPPRFADPDKLRSVIKGETATPYESTLLALGELANPRPGGGYDVSFPFRNKVYRLTQAAPPHPIELTITPSGGGPVELVLRYLPDGQIESSVRPEAHPTPEGLESTHHRILQKSILSERAQRILTGQNLYVRLRNSLEALKGRYTQPTQSVWYENFVFRDRSSYTFRIRNLTGLAEIEPNPQTSQISVYQEDVSQRVKLLTLSATGENNWALNRPDREPLSPQQLDQLRELVDPLERAKANPKVYEAKLHDKLKKRAGSGTTQLPEIAYSVEIPRNFGAGIGPRGEPLLEIRSTWDLWRHFHPWAKHRWQNPENSREVRQLSPPWRLSWHMSRELWRWMGEASAHASFGALDSPRLNPNLLHLHLFPEGGGQVTLHRDGNIHDILIAESSGPVWRASDEIERMKKKSVVFENRQAALDAAVATRGTGQTLPDSIQVQAAPILDLDRISFDPDGAAVKISDAATAWRRIQLQIPEGVRPRVQSTDSNLLAPDINSIHVDFRESQPLLQLEMRHYDIPSGGEKPVRRVEVVMRRGEDTHARVFEDGVPHPDRRDIHRSLLTGAQKGYLPVPWWKTGVQLLPRVYGYYKTSGGTYALSYFGALPIILGFEHLYLTKGERELMGTPVPWPKRGDLDTVKSFLAYFFHDFSIPFMTLSTASGVTGVLTDGAFNSAPGLASMWRMKMAGATFAEARRLTKPSFYNEYPHIRPIGRNIVRGFLQRSLPLMAGLVAIEELHHGDMNWTRLKDSALSVGAVSLASAAALNSAYRLKPISTWLLRRHWIEDTLLNGAALAEGGAARTALARGAFSKASRYALTFRGGVWVALCELIALGIWTGVNRRQWIDEMEAGLRNEVGNALDRRNELITRLEHGEEISPRLLIAADQDLQTAQGAYRHLLDLREKRKGSGKFSPLGLENDFTNAWAVADRNSLVTGGEEMKDAATWIEQEQFLPKLLYKLRERSERMDGERRELLARHGVATEASQEKGESLREFLVRLSSDKNFQEPAAPPISVDSPEGKEILQQFRWKAARDPSFLSWSPEQQGRYLLRQFRSYRVREADGSTRRWRLPEAMAFLAVAAATKAERDPSLESPTGPTSGKEMDAERLEAFFKEENERVARETVSRRYAQEHVAVLAGNVADFDAQMAAYYRTSNERMASALEGFMGYDLAAIPAQNLNEQAL